MIIFALMLAQSAAAAPAPPVLPAVFGLQLGAPIALPECQRMVVRFPTPGSPAPYTSEQPVTCQELSGSDAPGSENRRAVHFTPDKLPLIAGSEYMGATLIEGRLESLDAFMLSYNSADGIVRELTAKFGPPTARAAETVLVEKIPVPSIHVSWSRPGYSVDYHSIAENEIDHGELTIETDAGRALRLAMERARDRQRTPL